MEEKKLTRSKEVFWVFVVLGFAFCVTGMIYGLILNGLLSNGSYYHTIGFNNEDTQQYYLYTIIFSWMGLVTIAVACSVRLFSLKKPSSGDGDSSK